MYTVEIFTDGACRGNPGKGGWGTLLRCNGKDKELSGAEDHTTNNRMELMAAIKGLQALKSPCNVVLTTDSQYVKKGMTQWMIKWKANQWKTAAKQPVKNADLWQLLDAAVQQHHVTWRWVKGHSGHPENERVDELANLAIDSMITKG